MRGSDCQETRTVPLPIEAVDPGDFIHPSLYVADCTVPRLAKLCEVRPRGMMQIRDELAALFTSMKSAGSRPFYLECWNGDKFVVERVKDDRCFTVDNLLVGLIGGFQPDKLRHARLPAMKTGCTEDFCTAGR